MRDPSAVRQLLQDLKRALQRVYGKNLRGLYLLSEPGAKGMCTIVEGKVEQFLDEAQRVIQAAESLLQGGQLDFAAGRA